MYTILLVEDDPILQDLFPRALSRMDAKITVVGNGIEALEVLENQHFDLMIADINLPGVNGIDVIKHARMRLARHDMKIIAASANYIAIQNPVLKELADLRMEKPISSRFLLDACRELLGIEQPARKAFISQSVVMSAATY